jgi:hypothetical protein
MAVEKIAKAHAFVGKNSSVDDLTHRHTGASIKEFMKTSFQRFNAQTLAKAGQADRAKVLTIKIGEIASQIEKIQPAVDRDKSPQNAEYPWSDPRRIYVPCEHPFFEGDFLPEVWVEFVKTLRLAADRLIAGNW